MLAVTLLFLDVIMFADISRNIIERWECDRLNRLNSLGAWYLVKNEVVLVP